MLTLIPRSAQLDAPPPAVAIGMAVAAEAQRTPKPKPVEAGDPAPLVRRGREEAAARFAASADAAEATGEPAQAIERPVATPLAEPSLQASTPYLAQLIGQQSHQGDQWLHSRGLTSFRKSPIELYEQAHGRARRIEFLFDLEDRLLPAAA